MPQAIDTDVAPASAYVLRKTRGPDYLTVHSLLLLGYAVLGKLFAYIGFGSFYVGEIVLVLGILTFVTSPSQWGVLRSRHVWPLAALMLWGAARTVPYIETYGINALRDAVVWGYGTFAILIAARIAAAPETVSRLANCYASFVKIFLVGAPLVWVLSTGLGLISFTVHGRAVPVLKGGEMLVHLAGVIAFVYLTVRAVPIAWLTVAPVVFAVGATNRGGLLSLGIALIVLFVARRQTARGVLLAAAFSVVIIAAAAFDVRFKVPESNKELSPRTVAERVQSIFTDTSKVQYEATERWRLRWWKKIVQYTFFGPHFWFGKGFGPNVAYSDGVVSQTSDPLRSPHSGHFTFLARGGVPGLALWLFLQGAWFVGMVRRWRRCAGSGHSRLASMFLFLIVYWAALVINASFDVFLEGPMGGIWFWSVFGAGLGIMIAYDRSVAAVRHSWAKRGISCVATGKVLPGHC